MAVRDAIPLFKCKFTDDLLDLYLQKDFNKFWEIWQKKSNKGLPKASHTEGSTDENDIANKFAEYFSSFDLEFNSVIDNGIDTLNEQCDHPGNPVKCDEWLLNIEEVDSAVRNNLKLLGQMCRY